MKSPGWLSLLLASAAVALVVSCGGGGEPGEPLVWPGVAPGPVVTPAEWRYVEPGGRLAFPTPTAAPAPTVRPTLAVREVLRRVAPTRSPLVLKFGVEGQMSCEDEYRRMLIGYEGRAPFGAEVAERLSEELTAGRPGCVEEGWVPEFGLERVCLSTVVGGLKLSYGFLRAGGRLNTPTTLSTRRDESGNILVHFERLPLREESGCWYYAASQQAWGWVVAGVVGGVDRPAFPVCEGRLREVLAGLEDAEVGPLEVARAIDLVKKELAGECGTELWEVYPRGMAHGACEVEEDTGRWEEGLVVNWHPEHPAGGGAVCWVLSEGEWRESFPVEGE